MVELDMRMPIAISNGKPDSETPGWLGMLVMDNTNADRTIYKCVAADKDTGEYKWEPLNINADELADKIAQLSEAIDNVDKIANGVPLDYVYTVARKSTIRITTKALPMMGGRVTITATGEYNFAPVKSDNLSTWAAWTTNWTAHISDIEGGGLLLWIQKVDKSEITDDEVEEAISSVKVVYANIHSEKIDNLDANAVRFTPQEKTDAEKTQARTNIGAAAQTELNSLSVRTGELEAQLNGTPQEYQYTAERVSAIRLKTALFPMKGDRVTVTASGNYNFAPVKSDNLSTWAAWTTNWTAHISDIEGGGLLLWIQKVDKSEITDDEIAEAVAAVKVTYEFDDSGTQGLKGAVTVSPYESDNADYDSVSDALANGYTNILLYGGVYEQTITLPESGTISLAPLELTDIPVFVDPNRLKITSAEISAGNVYVADTSFSVLADTPRIFQDGIPDATTLIPDAERMPQQRGKEYRCDDTAIKRCTATVVGDALTEMQGTGEYKFFYDSANGKLYFTAPSADFATYPIVCSGDGVLFHGCNRGITLNVTGIECKYMRFDISDTVNSVISNCKCSGAYASALGQFMYDDAINPHFINCEACMSHGKNNGDGFNSHASNTGDVYAHQSGVVLENCWSHDNMDDGWSDHHRGEAIINGGLYEYNGKGGITPSYGTHCICRGVYSRNNYNGFYYISDSNDGGKYGQIICYDCVADNNNNPVGYGHAGFRLSGENNRMILVNCKSVNNTIGFECQKATNRMTMIDCGEYGNTTVKGTTGTYEVINTNRLS